MLLKQACCFYLSTSSIPKPVSMASLPHSNLLPASTSKPVTRMGLWGQELTKVLGEKGFCDSALASPSPLQ